MTYIKLLQQKILISKLSLLLASLISPFFLIYFIFFYLYLILNELSILSIESEIKKLLDDKIYLNDFIYQKD